MLGALRAPPVPLGRDVNPRRNARVTRPAALNSLISPIPVSLCRELNTSVFRCQELLSNPCQFWNPFSASATWKRSRCFRRHHFNVLHEERQRP